MSILICPWSWVELEIFRKFVSLMLKFGFRLRHSVNFPLALNNEYSNNILSLKRQLYTCVSKGLTNHQWLQD